MKCFYHSSDLDGHCSGAIVKHRFPEIELYGINYGEEFPWDKIQPTEYVYMVDFSLQPFSDMVRLKEACEFFTWIDHHKSAIIEWEEFNRPIDLGRLETSSAACELCWSYFYPGISIPKAVFWLGRYDIWEHQKHPGALEFQYGMRLYNTWPENQEFWMSLFNDAKKADFVRDQGALLLNYETEQNRKFASAYAFECELDGLRCIAVNKGFTNSLVFQSVYNPEKHDAMLSFAYRGGQWTVSLYADKPEVDCSVICKARGGGGHKGAAGFQCPKLPFIGE